MLPSASTLLSLGSPPDLGSILEKTTAPTVPGVPELLLSTREIVTSFSQTQFEVESHGGETDSTSEEETG